MRPRFSVELNTSAERVMESIGDRTEHNPHGIEAQLSDRHGVLKLPEKQRQFWSTQLGLTVEDSPPNDTDETPRARVLGIFSPHPEIWTAFVFAIGTLTVIGIFGTMYAVVQLSMGRAPTSLLATLIAALAGGLIYTSTLVGQGLAAGEMYQLRSHLDDCLADAQTRAEREPKTAEESAQL